MGAADGIERTLIAIAARCLRVAPQDIDPAAPLTRYGLDSLSALELTEAIAAETTYDLPEDLFYDAPSIQELALALLVHAPPAAGRDAEGTVARMRRDAVLADSIRPSGASYPTPGCILLTGANGFLGVHLVRSLLDENVREIVCLVRAGSDAHAGERVEAAREQYGLPPIDDRVRAIAADIGAPSLGLSPDTYRALAGRVGVVVHCAAEVNWAAGYEQLAPANVETTRELLRFACTGTTKAFHFVSSLAAGYSSREVQPFDELAPAADPEGLHLGYGQTKWVAERLVEQARARGLPAAIYRPTLIAGRSDSGIGNDDDLFSRMLRGCVALGAAPELDWSLDAVPVDFVARSVARASVRETTRSRVMHLRNPHPARWTEAVLWMNLRGYDVRLVPYARWAGQVRDEAKGGHPLQPLRGFLLHRPAHEGGLHLVELYARPHVRELAAGASDAELARLDVRCPRLGARLLERYFDRWLDQRRIDAPDRPAPATHACLRTAADAALETVLRRYFHEADLRVKAADGAEFGHEYSLIGELCSWRAGVDYAMQQRSVEVQRASGRHARIEVVLKQKLPDAIVLDVAQEVASLCDPALGCAFADFRERSEFAGARARECAVYAEARGTMREYMPLCFGIADGDPPTLVLERIWHTELANAVDDPARWHAPLIESVLNGIAAIHGQWLEDARVRARMKLHPGSDASREGLAWRSVLGSYAGRWLHPWLGSNWRDAHGRMLAGMEASCRWAAGQPHTLIHADLNPRNLAVRRTALGPMLCAFDWELAAWGLPQRDVAEFLAFVLPADVSPETLAHWLEFSRLALERRAQRSIDPAAWHAGMRWALADFGVTRLPMYLLAHRFRGQPFLERVARCWWRMSAVLGTAP